jgi:hypothetical protein
VGEPEPHGWVELTEANRDLPREALNAFPAIDNIMAKRIVRHN